MSFIAAVKAHYKIHVRAMKDVKTPTHSGWEGVTVDQVVKVLESIYDTLDDWMDVEQPEEAHRRAIEGNMKKYKKLYSKMSFPAVLYRCVGLYSIDKLNLDRIGNSWGRDEDAAVCYGAFNKSTQYVLKSKVAKKDIDWIQTIAEDITYMEGEREIYVRTGTPLVIEAYRTHRPDGEWVEWNKKGKA